MELTIQKQELLVGLNRTHGIADRKSSMHILSNVLLSAEGTKSLRLSATDLYLGMTCIVPANISKGGTIAVAARTLFDIVKNLPDGEIQWTMTESHIAELRCGKVHYRLPAMPGEDFPPLPNPGDTEFAELDAGLLSELIAFTQYSMSHDDTRPHLAGTLFEGDGQIVRMVTTDGHRLSKAERRLPKASSTPEFKMLVPYKGITELKKLVDEVISHRAKGTDTPLIGTAATGGNAYFRHGDLNLSVKLAEEQFPPYDKVIPQKQTRKIVAARPLLVEALRRISLVANDKSGGVQLYIEPGTIRLQSQNPDVGEGSEELDVDYAGEGMAIGFNARYLLDALTALPHDEVALELSGELDPGVVKPVGGNSDFVGVIMPMRI